MTKQSRPLRMSERLTWVLGAHLDVAIELVRRDPTKPKHLKTVNAGSAKSVLVSIADFHGADGRIYPGVDRIAMMACVSRDTVPRVTALLEFIDVMRVKRRNALKGQARTTNERTNWYTLNWDAIIELAGDHLQPRLRRDSAEWCILDHPAACWSNRHEFPPPNSDLDANCVQIMPQTASTSGRKLRPELDAVCVLNRSSSTAQLTAQLNRAGAAASQRRESQSDSGELLSGFDDDEQSPPQGAGDAIRDSAPEGDNAVAVARIRDGADVHEVKAFLVETCGVGGGRAHKIAHNPHATPNLVNSVLTRCAAYNAGIGNKGAYVAGLIEDAIADAKRERRQHETEASQARLSWKEQVEASIEHMSDEALAAVIGEIAGLTATPAEARKYVGIKAVVRDHILRKEAEARRKSA